MLVGDEQGIPLRVLFRGNVSDESAFEVDPAVRIARVQAVLNLEIANALCGAIPIEAQQDVAVTGSAYVELGALRVLRCGQRPTIIWGTPDAPGILSAKRIGVAACRRDVAARRIATVVVVIHAKVS